jgi:hypothetical protein
VAPFRPISAVPTPAGLLWDHATTNLGRWECISPDQASNCNSLLRILPIGVFGS